MNSATPRRVERVRDISVCTGLAMATSCFDPTTCIFSSPRAAIHIPPDLDVCSCLFSLTSARRFHHRLAIADASTGEALTFLQLHQHVYSVARAISFLGIKQHDVVFMLSPNSVHFPVVFFAIISLGAVVTTMNPACTSSEICKQVKDSKAKLILTTADLAGQVVDAALPVIFIDDSKPNPNPNANPHPNPNPNEKPSTMLLSEVIIHAAHHRIPHIRIKQTDTAALLYSSGTTGISKGVVLSHRNFIASALQINYEPDLHKQVDMTHLCIVPMFHVYGASIILFGQLQKGNTIITMPKFNFILMLQAVETYRITNMPLVPPILLALVKQEVVKKFDLSSVTEVDNGAAPISKETLEEICQRFNVPEVRQGYGMTEATGIVATGVLGNTKKNYATVGPLVSGMEAVIVDPSSGDYLHPNKQGELWVRGPNVMQGYFNNPEATASTLDKDGWLRTGDLGHIDDEGNVYITDRLKELIKYKGFQVAPAELEGLLLTHPQIADAAVVPYADNEAGEVPLAYVVRSSGSSIQEQDIIEFVASQVAPYKKVRKVKFIETIPKSSAGKILRRQLVHNLQSKL